MISPWTLTNLQQTLSYFKDHLNSGDYYDQNKTTPGIWMDKGAKEWDMIL